MVICIYEWNFILIKERSNPFCNLYQDVDIPASQTFLWWREEMESVFHRRRPTCVSLWDKTMINCTSCATTGGVISTITRLGSVLESVVTVTNWKVQWWDLGQVNHCIFYSTHEKLRYLPNFRSPFLFQHGRLSMWLSKLITVWLSPLRFFKSICIVSSMCHNDFYLKWFPWIKLLYLYLS